MSTISQRLRHHWFPVALCLITFVSLFDTYLIVHFEGVIDSTEENPIGRWLLEMGQGSIWVFVRMKLAGTICVVSTLYGMWASRSRLVVPVTTSVATYQTGLFFYLTVS
jgi:hypothetical protein